MKFYKKNYLIFFVVIASLLIIAIFIINSQKNYSLLTVDMSKLYNNDFFVNGNASSIVCDTNDRRLCEDSFDCIVKVLASEQDNNKSTLLQKGSGVIINSDNNNTSIITCLHNLTNQKKILPKINVEISGNIYEAKAVYVDANNDIAILNIKSPQQVCALISEDSIDLESIYLGDVVTAIGYKADNEKVATKGQVASVYTNKEGLVLSTNSIASGLSGGGLFNIDGRLIGIIKSKTLWDIQSNEWATLSIPICKIYTQLSNNINR